MGQPEIIGKSFCGQRGGHAVDLAGGKKGMDE